MKLELGNITRYFIYTAMLVWMFVGTLHAASNPQSSDTTKITNSKQSLISAKNRSQVRASALAEESDKLINNVKVYYNPIAEQISVNFKLNKSSHISIKVMDALGNELLALHSGDLEAGSQNLSFDVSSKLKEGFYFVRVMGGSETVVKRISVR